MSFYPNNPRNLKLIKYLKEKYKVRSCFLASKSQSILEEDKENFVFNSKEIKTKFSKFLALLYYYFYLIKVIQIYRPNIIFAYHWEIFILVRLVTFFHKKIKIVYDISDIPAYFGKKHMILKKIEEFFINKKIFLIFASPYFREKYKKFRDNNYFILNNKPEKKIFQNIIYKKNQEGKITAAFFGVFRDPEIFENIFKAMKDFPILLKMRGSGYAKNKIEKIAKNYTNIEIGDEYTYEQLPKLYEDIDIIMSLYSNRDENTYLALGNKYFEAIALKKIGFFPKGTKMGDLALKEKIGIVVDPYDIKEIRKFFKEITDNTEIIKEIKKNLLFKKEEEIFYEYEVEKFLPKLKNFINNG
ncbi:hypothetical protein FUSO4_10295 [Fusobacterium necrophorum DJ-1]|uniref:Glycosyl transferase family 1 domain-containing protein n=3 Tax=Fusobacterium necrophorum TaxID=859 RepID=A0AB73C521_9FUSO|nr:hypothetical protein FUSO4_10295 [Fusobacterium necrophorum DJ-1]KDE73233.1 hypothetical protein FUSO8_02200 [Fusobacterium necrophorum DJ-2]